MKREKTAPGTAPWRVLPGLVVAPIAALADQSVAYAMLGWSCASQSLVAPHLVHAGFATLALVTTAIAAREWRALPQPARDDAGTPVARHRFLAIVATLAGALSALAILAMWIPQWMLSPCVS